MRRAADAGAGDFLAVEKFCEGGIEGREVLGVAQTDTHVHHIAKVGAGSAQHAVQIGEGLARLCGDVGGHHFLAYRIERPLTRYKQHVAKAYALGQWRGRGGIGEAGGGGGGGGDDLLRHDEFPIMLKKSIKSITYVNSVMAGKVLRQPLDEA